MGGYCRRSEKRDKNKTKPIGEYMNEYEILNNKVMNDMHDIIEVYRNGTMGLNEFISEMNDKLEVLRLLDKTERGERYEP